MALRRIMAIGAAAVTTAGIIIAGGSAASADTVSVSYTCSGFGFPVQNFTYSVTITAPATATRGQTVTLQASIAATSPSSQNVAAGVNRAELDIVLGGASSGTVTATGLTNPSIQAGTPWRVEGGQAQVTLSNAGTVSFTPATWRMTTFHYGCSVKNGTTAPVADTTSVS